MWLHAACLRVVCGSNVARLRQLPSGSVEKDAVHTGLRSGLSWLGSVALGRRPTSQPLRCQAGDAPMVKPKPWDHLKQALLSVPSHSARCSSDRVAALRAPPLNSACVAVAASATVRVSCSAARRCDECACHAMPPLRICARRCAHGSVVSGAQTSRARVR
jgi:hypothetical protein